ncbi:hypothetical protein O1L55_04070 [Streptomyces albulus]|nr:hypothetical protein [Streptomyces noursei]
MAISTSAAPAVRASPIRRARRMPYRVSTIIPNAIGTSAKPVRSGE